MGAIDVLSKEIDRLQIEPKELYYFGHRRYHAIHTQAIIVKALHIWSVPGLSE